VQCAIIIGSTVFLFNFSTGFSNEIQIDDAQKPVFIGTILHCTYSFWGLCPKTPTGALPLDPAGGLPSPRPPALPLHPLCHYIVDKGLAQTLFSAGLRPVQYKTDSWYCWMCAISLPSLNRRLMSLYTLRLWRCLSDVYKRPSPGLDIAIGRNTMAVA